MKTGHKRQLAGGILELVLGIGLILYVLPGGPAADRPGGPGRGGGDGGPSDLLRRLTAAAGQEEECTA